MDTVLKFAKKTAYSEQVRKTRDLMKVLSV